jgi:hypothetical protein
MNKLIVVAAATLGVGVVSGLGHAAWQTTVGGSGGTTQVPVSTPDGGWATGFWVQTGRFVDKIALKNGSGNGGVIGALSSNAAASDIDCPGSSPFVDGIRGFAGRYVDNVTAHCSRGDGSIGVNVVGPTLGGWGGTGGSFYQIVCPTGQHVPVIQGAGFNSLDRLQIYCR